jgi:hypothetical protein
MLLILMWFLCGVTNVVLLVVIHYAGKRAISSGGRRSSTSIIWPDPLPLPPRNPQHAISGSDIVTDDVIPYSTDQFAVKVAVGTVLSLALPVELHLRMLCAVR